MNTESGLQNATSANVAAGAASPHYAGSLTTIIGGVVVLACFAAPLFLTLPETMDSAARPSPLISEAVAADVREPTFHERHPVQGSVDWTDTLDEARLAQ